MKFTLILRSVKHSLHSLFSSLLLSNQCQNKLWHSSRHIECYTVVQSYASRSREFITLFCLVPISYRCIAEQRRACFCINFENFKNYGRLNCKIDASFLYHCRSNRSMSLLIFTWLCTRIRNFILSTSFFLCMNCCYQWNLLQQPKSVEL